MKNRCFRTTIVVILSLLFTVAVFAQNASTTMLPYSKAQASRAVKAESNRFFIQNKGQWDAQAQYLANLGNARAWITGNGITYDYYTIHCPSPAPIIRQRETTEETIQRLKNTHIKGHVVQMSFEGASASALHYGDKQQSGRYNYFLGNDASKWATNVSLYGEVVSNNIYPGIDIRYYYEGQHIRYDFVVSPGSNASNIALRFKGQEKVELGNEGELLISTSLGEIKHHKLFAYQMVNGIKKQVACEFVQGEDGCIRFHLGEYDSTNELIIDPVVYSTFLGGAAGFDGVQDIAVDVTGNAYILSDAASSNFPTSSGAYDVTANGLSDVAVTKFNATGSLVYSTFVGGANFDFPRAIAIDGSNNAYFTGTTFSSGYPTTVGCYDDSFSSGFGATSDCFVTKLNSAGSTLMYSTFIGSDGSEEGMDIAVNALGEAYVGGTELKFGPGRHPVTLGAYNVGIDAADGFSSLFLTKFNATGSGLIYSALWGTPDTTDNFGGLALDNAGNAVVYGHTRGFTYPTTAGVYQPAKNSLGTNNRDIVVTKFNATGTGLIFSTFVGASRNDNSVLGGIAVDANNSVYFTGETTLDTTNVANYPTTAGAFKTTINRPVGDNALYTEVFVSKLNSTGTTLSYSTYLGTDSIDQVSGITLDASGNAVVVGVTNDGNFPVTAGATQTTPGGFGNPGFWEHYVTKLNSTGTALLFSTYSGGSGQETGGGGVAVNPTGDTITFAMSTNGTNYPTSPGAFQSTAPGGGADGVVVKMAINACTLTGVTNPATTTGTAGTFFSQTFTQTGGSGSTTFSVFSGTLPNGLSLAPSTGVLSGTPTQAGTFPIVVRATDGSCFVNGSTYNLVINCSAITMASQPANTSVCPNTTATFTSTANGIPTPTVQWQVSTNGGGTWGNISGANSTTLSFTAVAADNGKQYRAQFSNTCNGVQNSDPATLTILAQPVFTVTPGNITVNAMTPNSCSSPLSYTITANGSPAPTYNYVLSGATIGNGSGTGSGSTFNGGTTFVTVTAANTCGSSVYNFTVTVNDNQAPTLNCPSNITTAVSTNNCGAAVTYSLPTVTDNCSQSRTFTYTGAAQTWTVPAGVTSILVEAYGAQGGNGASAAFAGGTGGLGSKASGILSVTPGEVLTIMVGGQGGSVTGGFNGGGNGGASNGGGGGGASDVRQGGAALANRVVVGGGGGGGGTSGCVWSSGGGTGPGAGGNGGNGDGNGQNGATTSSGGGGFGAVGQNGGAAGIGCGGFLGTPGAAASGAIGGSGGGGQVCCCFDANSTPGGGGGGGGFVGGGAGGGGSAGTVGCSGNDKGGGGGGAGGSSYIGAGTVSSGSVTSGAQSGHGQVVITMLVQQTAGLASGATFPIGTTTNSFSYRDFGGNQATCSFNVTVQAPEMNIKGNGVSIVNNDNSPSTTDNTDFGGLVGCIASSVVKTFVIENIGTSVLNLTGTSPNYVSIGGVDAADFSVTTQPAASVAVNGTESFTITFSPSSVGTKNATVTIANNDCNENPYTFAIRGSRIDTYTFTGTGNWTDVARWSPAYPGTTLPPACTVIVDGHATVQSPLTVTTGGPFTINTSASLTLAAGSNLVIPTTAGPFQNNGTINVNGTFAVNAEISSPGSINVGAGGTVKGTGAITTSTLTIPAGAFIAPGASPGCLTITGNHTISGTMLVEVAGATACTQYDRLIVTGTATISAGATLDLSNYTATPGSVNNYTILTANSIGGAFTNVIYPTLPGYCMTLTYTTTSVVFNVYKQPNPSFTAFPTPVCTGGGVPDYTYTYTVNPGSIGSGFTYNWSIPVNATITAGAANSNTVTLRFTSGTSANLACTVTRTDITPNCATTINQTVTITPAPTIGFTNPLICPALNSWTQYRPIDVTITGPAITDYRMLLTINTQALISGGAMRSDGADMRFTVGCTQIPFWIESGLNTPNTKVWVKVPTVAAASTTVVRMFHGNPAASFAVPNAASNVFESNVVSLFSFTEGSGTIVHDWAGGFDMNMSGGATWAAGFRPGVSSVTGFSSGRLFHNGNGPLLGSGSFTVIDFVYATNPNGSTQGMIGNYHDDGTSGWVLKQQGGSGQEMLLTNQGGNWCQSSAGNIPANQWAMVGARRNAGVINSVFVNGVNAANICAGDNRNVDNSGPYEIGRSYNGSYALSGNASLVVVYNRALSDAEILAITRGINPSEQPTITFGSTSLSAGTSPVPDTVCRQYGLFAIQLANSQVGTTYQAINTSNGNVVISVAPVTGTGLTAPLLFNTMNTGFLTGANNISVVGVNGAGCQSTAVAGTMVINENPNPSFSAVPTPVCSGGGNPDYTYTYTVSPGNVGSSFTYQWTLPPSATLVSGSVTSTSVTLRWAGSGSNTLTCMVTRNDVSPVCPTTISTTVDVNMSPQGPISGVTTTCANVDRTYSLPNAANTNYVWSITPGTGFSGQGTNSIQVNWATVGTKTITCVMENLTTGCDNTVTLGVTVNTLPTPSISGAASVCTGTSQTYSTPNTVGSTYQWSVTGGTISGSGNSISVAWTQMGAQTISLTETNGSGCSAAASKTVNVYQTPAPSISGANVACVGETKTYTTPVVSGMTNQWSVSTNGQILANNGNNIDVKWNGASATSTVTLTQINQGNTSCATTVVYNVSVGSVPAPSFTAAPSPTCTGQQATYSITPIVGATYAWTVIGGSVISGATTNSIVVQWSTPSNSNLVSVAATVGSCTGGANVTVITRLTPTPAILGDNAACTGQSKQYMVAQTTANSFSWAATNGATFPNGNTSASVTVLFNNQGLTNITVTETNVNCATTTSAFPVVVSTTPNPSLSSTSGGLSTAGVCAFSTHNYSVAALGGSTYNWTVSGGQISSGAGSNSITVVWGGAGQGSVALQHSNGNCIANAQASVTINPLPTPALSGAQTTCVNQIQNYATTFTAGRSYTWTVTLNSGAHSFTAGSNAANINVQWNASGSGAVSVTETVTATGCSTTTPVYAVTVNALPAPSVSGATTACAGESKTYTTPAVTGSQYVWTVLPTGTSFSGQGTNSINVSWGSVSGSVQLQQTTAAGCSATSSVLAVTVSPVPTPNFSLVQTACVNQQITLAVATPSGTSTYAWTVPGATIISGTTSSTTVVVAWSSSGSKTVSLSETTSAGCSASITKSILVNTIPVPVVTGANSACAGDTKSYNVASPSGTSTYSWAVSNGAIQGANTGTSISVLWATAGASSVSVTETTNNNCVGSSAAFAVTVNSKPNPVISSTSGGLATSGVCLNSTHNYSTANNVGSQYLWTVTGGNVLSGQNTASVQVQWVGSQGSIKVRETNAANCATETTTTIIIINPPTTPVISGDAQACVGQSKTYSVAFQSGVSYAWNVTLNGNAISFSSNTQGNSITVPWNAAGNGVVNVTATMNGCSSAATPLQVAVNALPTPSISGDATACATQSKTYSAPFVAGDSYMWTVTPTASFTGQGTNSIIVSWNNAGSYTVALTETTGAGCSASTSKAVVVNTKPQPVPSGPATACTGQTLSFSATSVLTGSQFVWSVNGTSVTTSSASPSASFVITTAGQHTVRITETSAQGCIGFAEMTVQVFQTPTPSISGATSVCAGSVATYAVAQPMAGSNFSWNVTGGTIQGVTNGSSISVLWATAGTGSVRVTETNNGCSANSNTVGVNVIALPVASISSTSGGLATFGVCEGSTHSYTTPLVSGASYLWTVTNGAVVSGQATNSVSVQWNENVNSGSIKVRVIAQQCTTETAPITIIINAKPEPTVTGESTACEGTTKTYTTPFTLGNQYNWTVKLNGSNFSFTNGANAATINVQWTTPGGGEVSVTETVPSTGCSAASAVKMVTVNALPNPVITPSATQLCVGRSATFSVANVNGHSYQWTVTPTNALVQGQGTNSITVTFPSAGTGTVQVLQTNTQTACSKLSAIVSVSIGAVPNPTIIGPQAVCANSTQTYSLQQPGTNSSFIWSVTGGTITSGAGSSSIGVLWGGAGSGTVTVTEVIGICSTTVSKSVTINPLPVPTVSGPAQVCVGSTNTYQVVNPSNTSSYNWSFAGGTPLNGTSGPTFSLQFAATVQTAFVSVNETNTFGCSATSAQRTVTLVAYPAPVISSATGMPKVCVGSTHTYTTPLTAGNTYNWTINAPAGTTVVTNNNSVTLSYSNAGSASISVMETNPTGCSTMVTTNVTVNPLPTPQISGVQAICLNRSATFGTANNNGSTYLWTATGGGVIQGANNLATVTVLFNATTPCTLTVTETTANGCSKQSTAHVVTVNPLPAPAITSPTGGMPAVCALSTHTYTTPNVNGNSYQWNVNGGTISSGQNTNSISVLWSAGTGGVITVTETVTATQCTTTTSTSVAINALPAPQVEGKTLVCTNTPIRYSVLQVAGHTYNWTVNANATVTAGAVPSEIFVTWNSTGASTVSVNQINTATGCSKSSQLSVQVVAAPAPVLTGNSPVCAGTNVSYSLINTAGNSYTWSLTGGGTIVNGQGTSSIQVAWAQPGDYTLSVTERNVQLDCQGTASRIIRVNTTPAPVVSGLSLACAGQTNTYTTPVVTGDTYNWTVSGGTIESGQGTNQIVVRWATTASIGSVMVTQSNGLCSRQSSQVAVQIFQLSGVTLLGTDKACQNSTSVYEIPNLPGLNYAWVVTGGTIQSGQGTNRLTVVWSNSTSGQISVTVSSPLTSCSAVAQRNVVLNPIPSVTIQAGGNTTICEGESVPLGASPLGFASYRWSNGATTNGISVTQPGAYSVTVTDANGCSATSNTIVVTLAAAPAPQITANGPLQFCAGGSVSLDAGAGYVLYRWSNGATTRTITVTSPGLYSVKVTNTAGCERTSPPVQVVVTSAPKPLIAANGPLSFCSGNNVVLDAGVGYQTYLWSTGATTRTITVTQAGTYTVQAFISPGCGGTSDPLNVVVNQTPEAVATSQGATTICQGESVVLKANDGMASYIWSNGATTQSITVTVGGSYSVEVKNAAGCSDISAPVVVTVNPLPTPTVTLSGNTLSVTATAGSSFQWQRGQQDITGATQQTLTPTQDGVYRVRVTNSSGCSAFSNEVNVKLGPNSVADEGERLGLSLRPNPVVNMVTVSFQCECSDAVTVEIMNAIGVRVAAIDGGYASGSYEKAIDLSGFASGTYIMRVRVGAESFMKRFVVEK